MKKISFVVLHYGDIGITKECIASILELETEDMINIVIVDNDYQKNEDEREKLNWEYRQSDNIEIIRICENIGFSRANNEGYKYIVEKYHPDFIIVTNNDIVFEQRDFLERMKESYRKYQYEVLGPDVVSRRDGLHQSPIADAVRTNWQINYTIVMNAVCLKLFSILYPLLYLNNKRIECQRKHRASKITDQGSSPQIKENIVPCGACIILSKQFIAREQKVFFPETQFYYEEYILHYRCLKNGYKILYDPKLRVLHGDGVATKKKTKNEKRKMRFIMEHTLQAVKIYKKLLQDESMENI